MGIFRKSVATHSAGGICNDWRKMEAAVRAMRDVSTNKRFPVLIHSIMLERTNVVVRFNIPPDVPDGDETSYSATVRSRILEALDEVARS